MSIYNDLTFFVFFIILGGQYNKYFSCVGSEVYKIMFLPCRDLNPGASKFQADDLPISHRACNKPRHLSRLKTKLQIYTKTLKKLIKELGGHNMGHCIQKFSDVGTRFPIYMRSLVQEFTLYS